MFIILLDYVKWLEARSLIMYAFWELLVDYPILGDMWVGEMLSLIEGAWSMI